MTTSTLIDRMDLRKLVGVAGIGTVLLLSAVAFHTVSADRRIAVVHGYPIGGNLGHGTAYDVELVNGTGFHYSTYTSDHPLCRDGGGNAMGIDCSDQGTTETDDGFDEVAAAYHNGTGITVDDRMLPVGTCLDARRNLVHSCPPSPVQLAWLPVRAASMALGW